MRTLKKGISPLVAAVLLIAATMSIAGILAYWASSFVRTQTTQWENQTISSQCSFADFRVYSCSYSANASRMILILENIRDVELKSLNAYIIYSNDTSSSPISLNDTLPSTSLKTFYVYGVSSDFSKILIKTSCPEISASTSCTRG